MTDTLEAFRHYREKMNAAILAAGHRDINRFFALDTRTYEAGALPARTKELLGLVASLVLRCDDCITYHVVRCREEGVSRSGVLRRVRRGAGRGRLDRDPAPAPRRRTPAGTAGTMTSGRRRAPRATPAGGASNDGC